MAPPTSLQGRINKAGSRLIPLFLICVVGYATWVEVVLIGVVYLIQAHPGHAPRTGVGAAIIALHFVFLVPAATAFFRTLSVVLTQPGYVPRRDGGHRQGPSGDHAEKDNTGAATSDGIAQFPLATGYLNRVAVLSGRIAPPAGLENYYSRDVYECEVDGLPRFCNICKSWKPDRAHHSSESRRCLYKFDHYCPWAGGPVAEPSFKFFVQFCVYACIFCAFIVISTAYFVAERHNKFGTYDVNWIIIMAVAALFLIFSGGMSSNALHAILLNLTTIDKLSRRSRIHYLAVLIPQRETNLALQGSQPAEGLAAYQTITYPLPNTAANAPQPSSPRCFAILASPTGTNPYRLSSHVENFKTIMGSHFMDWVLPFRRSNCCSHSQQNDRFGRVMYQLGPVVDQMMMDAGLIARPTEHPRRDMQYWERSNQIQHPRSRGEDGHTYGRAQLPMAEFAHTTSTVGTNPAYVPAYHQRQAPQPTPELDPPGSLTMSRLHGNEGGL